MTKAGDKILRGAREARRYARGEGTGAVVHKPVDVAAIRKGTGLTQEEFAKAYGMSVGALRDWEQGRKAPERLARTILKLIERAPELVQQAAREAA